ncbi:MAG: NAD(P)H-dependent oxidoreductase subunit E [Burkholderiales bacterium]|nr:NAD(P)H-dependent oxidoreductase subunit E [Burkholderiales bacterium]MDE2288612.1 NAD(P)H-dependent oxidoreductase subunit E [Burkholderiales bacterium]
MAPQSSETLLPVIERYAGKPASLLVLLHELQDLAGYVPSELVPQIASKLNLSRAEVHGVLTYYHDFRDSPPPRVVVKLCRAEACQSMGTEALAAHIEAHTGCRFDGKRDGALGLESVYCLGQCAQSPALLINDRLYAKVTPAKFDTILTRAQEEGASA